MEIYVYDAETLRVLCQSRGKWGLLISFTPTEKDIENGQIADAPYLDIRKPLMDSIDATSTIMCCGGGILLFDTEDEMRKYYGMTYGDDDGGSAYALTCNPEGVLLSENT